MLIKRAGLAVLDDVAPIFDAYRQFYGQRPDVAAARAFLGRRAIAYESSGWRRDDEFQHFQLLV